MRFDGKVALITGAASGIGWATAARMAAEGARVVLADLDVEQLAERAAVLGPDVAVGIPTDVADQAACEAVVAGAVETFGGLDVLVNNAGMGSFGRVGDMDPAQWRRVMAVDVDGVFFACRAALPHLIATRGCIVNTASISGMAADYGFSAYNAAKAAVIALTRTMAIDYGRESVRVNCVSPGLVVTPMANLLHQTPAIMAQYRERVPLGRGAEPEEIAAAMCFLASADASYVTGTNLVIDGGLTAHTGQPDFSREFAVLQAGAEAGE